MSKGSIHQEDITTPNLKFNIAPDMYRQNWQKYKKKKTNLQS